MRNTRLLSAALEGSRAAKWAPRNGAPKGEAEEEENDDDEEDEDKEAEEEVVEGRWRVEGHPTLHPLSAFYLGHPSPHPPVCRQSSSSLGLPLRCYHRGYSSATNVRSCFPLRCSNPRGSLLRTTMLRGVLTFETSSRDVLHATRCTSDTLASICYRE